MRLCIQCAHYQDKDPGVTAPTCGAEVVSPVDGVRFPVMRDCWKAREFGQVCGPDGALFVAAVQFP